jgi:hypothetical protein
VWTIRFVDEEVIGIHEFGCLESQSVALSWLLGDKDRWKIHPIISNRIEHTEHSGVYVYTTNIGAAGATFHYLDELDHFAKMHFDAMNPKKQEERKS